VIHEGSSHQAISQAFQQHDILIMTHKTYAGAVAVERSQVGAEAAQVGAEAAARTAPIVPLAQLGTGIIDEFDAALTIPATSIGTMTTRIAPTVVADTVRETFRSLSEPQVKTLASALVGLHGPLSAAAIAAAVPKSITVTVTDAQMGRLLDAVQQHREFQYWQTVTQQAALWVQQGRTEGWFVSTIRTLAPQLPEAVARTIAADLMRFTGRVSVEQVTQAIQARSQQHVADLLAAHLGNPQARFELARQLVEQPAEAAAILAKAGIGSSVHQAILNGLAAVQVGSAELGRIHTTINAPAASRVLGIGGLQQLIREQMPSLHEVSTPQVAAQVRAIATAATAKRYQIPRRSRLT